MSREHWERQAGNWLEWARRPDFDSYWRYSGHFFDLVPPPGRRTIDVGCGEGRVTRDLAARGHRVVGVDASPSLIRLARDADSAGDYVRCDAAALPFDAGSFDLAVLYNSLMDFDDMEGGVREAGRVLRTGGRMCVSITHPMQDAGRFASHDPGARFIVEDDYLEPRRAFDAAVEEDDLRMHFRGWAYPVETYSRALEQAGFAIEALREPRVEGGDERWRRIPLFLMWRAVKTG
jgi:SAM-dependent methyltransferase